MVRTLQRLSGIARIEEITSADQSTRDRRWISRQPPHGERSRPELVLMIIGMYREMPGLCLYLQQAARLCGLTAETYRIVLDDRVASGRLYRKPDGQYAAA